MPRYEQLKLAQTKKRESFTYTKVCDTGKEEKKSVIMKPLIIAMIFIIVSAVVFAVVSAYSQRISIAIKDIFRKEKPEAISLIADPNITTNENNSFLKNFETFKFLIQPEDNTNKLEVIVTDITNRFETSVRENIISNTAFTNIIPEKITRTSLIPFYNNPDIVREQIEKEEISKKETEKNDIQKQTEIAVKNNYETSARENTVNTHTNIFNNIDLSKSYNKLDILKKDTFSLSNIDFDILNNLNKENNNAQNNLESNNVNNVIVENNTASTNTAIKTTVKTASSIIKTQTHVKIKLPEVKNTTAEKTKPKKEEIINATEFSEILKPKNKTNAITKTMKPAASSYSYTLKAQTPTKNEETDYTALQKEKPAVTVKREEIKKEETKTESVKKENTVIINPKKEYIPQVSYNPQAAIKKYYEEKKESVPTPSKDAAQIDAKTPIKNEMPQVVYEDNEKKIKESVLPKNINESAKSTESTAKENIIKESSLKENILRENTATRYENTNSKNTLDNENTAYALSSITRPVEKKGITYTSITQTPSYIVSRDFNTSQGEYTPNKKSSVERKNQINAKRGIFLVEHNEESGTITLIFKERIFENKNPTLEEVIIALLNGATDKENRLNIISCISRETKLLDIFRDDNILYLNFNDAFEYNPLGSEGMLVQLYQIVYTATQFEGIDSVIFLINGKFNETIGSEGYIVNKPFSRLGRNDVIKSAE